MSIFTISNCSKHLSKGWTWTRWACQTFLFQIIRNKIFIWIWSTFYLSEPNWTFNPLSLLPWFRLFLWRNWLKADFRTIWTSSNGSRSSLMPITMVKSTTRSQPDRVRMPFPLPTPVSRFSTCQRSPTMQPAPQLQVHFICYVKQSGIYKATNDSC